MRGCEDVQGVVEIVAYFNELSFASGYYHISAYGIVTFRPDTPQEIRDKFWQIWPEFRRKVIEKEKAGIYSSAYPFLPIEEVDPNLEQYQKNEQN